MPISIRIEGLSEVIGKLPAIPKTIERRVILDMSQIVYDEAQAGAGRHSKTGNLVASLFNRAIPGGREVGHDPQRAPHAIFVNAGTRDHFVAPRDKKALRWAGGGKFFFSKGHKVKGYRGDAYMIGALTTALRQFQTIVDNATKEAAQP